MVGEALRVLVVEDAPDHAELIRRALRRQYPPFDVTVVGDGFACLEAVAQQQYAIVLLDYSLPRMNGLEVLEGLRPIGVPVVMVTGQGDERVAVEAMAAGAVDYVVKTSGYLAALPTVLCKALKQHELALENSRLYEEAQGRLRESEALLVELKATQERLVRGETLRTLGELASGAAHHLNNLLAVIMGRVDLLLLQVESGGLRRPLEIISRATRDGAEVVRRIQQFARTKQVGNVERVDLNDLAREVVEMTAVRWRDAARVQGISIEVVCEGDKIPLVSGHAASLREVITNLVLNAVDALPSGGRISVRTWADDDMVSLSIVDNGLGMPEEIRRRAQEPFFTTKGLQSTGLGLSVNHGIVKRHGGDMTIASTEGRGTTVTIRLPVAIPASTEAPGPSSPATASFRVLVIDDEQEVRESLAELLAIEGHTVTQAAGGHEGLARLEAGPLPDVVLTDLGMPGMTGAEVALAVKRRWPQVQVGIITGWGLAERATMEQQAVVDFLLGKPVSLGDLRETFGRIRTAAPAVSAVPGSARGVDESHG
jgi:signal transduction histidine kinase